jgi:hypothetical protein
MDLCTINNDWRHIMAWCRWLPVYPPWICFTSDKETMGGPFRFMECAVGIFSIYDHGLATVIRVNIFY